MICLAGPAVDRTNTDCRNVNGTIGSNTGTACDWTFVSQRDVPVCKLSVQSIQLTIAQVCAGTDER